MMGQSTLICAKAHVYKTRFRLFANLWWRKHDKCFEEIYGCDEEFLNGLRRISEKKD
jgi:hypothetical protein